MIDYYSPGDEHDDNSLVIALLDEIDLEMLPDVEFEYDPEVSYYADPTEAAGKADLRRRNADVGAGSPLNDLAATATAVVPIPGVHEPEKSTTSSEHKDSVTETTHSGDGQSPCPVQHSCLSQTY
jgi:hypothetical protein